MLRLVFITFRQAGCRGKQVTGNKEVGRAGVGFKL